MFQKEKGRLKKKAVSGMMLTLLFMSILTLAFNIQPAKVEPTTIIVPDDYTTIQEAINAASSGDTIFVRNGTYYANVVVNKALKLVGETVKSTIIDGGSTGSVITIVSNGTTIQNLTIRNSAYVYPDSNGIHVKSSSNLIESNIIANNHNGIFIEGFDNILKHNDIISNNGTGLQLWTGSYNNLMTANNITYNGSGVQIVESHNNTLTENNIFDNERFGIGIGKSENNTIFHNNFINNTANAFTSGMIPSLSNAWDAEYPSGGNYWSDYVGEDNYSGLNQDQLGSDGLGDIPYIIDENNVDHYPLMEPYLPLGFQASHSTNTPLIDGSATDPEWNDANSYEIILEENQGTRKVSAGVYFKHDGTYIYIGLKIFAGQHDFDEFIFYFDEGDDGEYGSGTRDGFLTLNQEDLKGWLSEPIAGHKIEDGCYKNGTAGAAWYGYLGGDFEADCSFVLDHWECEFSIPFVGSDGGVEDVSDLVCSVSDTIGIKIQYFTQPGAGNYYYPVGTNREIQTYATLSFDPEILCDLSVTSQDISFSETIFPGSVLTMTTVIHNVGEVNAENVNVQFFDNQNLIGERIISLSHHSESTVVMDLNVDEGLHQIGVLIDPGNAHVEIDEENNRATRSVLVGTWIQGGITLTGAVNPPVTNPGSPVTVSGTAVYNTSYGAGIQVAGADVIITVNGQEWLTHTISDGTYTVSIAAPYSPGNYKVVVMITDYTFWEKIELDLIVEPIIGLDVALAYHDLSFSLTSPAVGDYVTINATVHNVGTEDASNVLVGFYDNGLLIGSSVITSLPTGGSKVVTIVWEALSWGWHMISVIADPLNTLIESNEFNNVATKKIYVYPSQPDLTLRDITLSDITPVIDQDITVLVDVANIGGTQALDVILRFYDDGAIFGEHKIPFIPGKGGIEGVAFEIGFGSVGWHELTVVVDPEDAIGEAVETNNHLSIMVFVHPPRKAT